MRIQHSDKIDKNEISQPIRLSLRRNFKWNFVGNLVYAACQWGIVMVLAKLTSPEMVGRFALGLAITAPIIQLSQLQLRGVQATDARDKYAFGHYLMLRLITTGIAMVVIAGVVVWGGYALDSALVILAVGVSKGFESVADVFYGLMQRHERMDRIARSRILKGTVSLVIMVIIVFVTGNVFLGVLGLAGVWGAVLLTYDLRNAVVTLNGYCQTTKLDWTSIMPQFDLYRLSRLVWLSLPLGLATALNSLKANIPRYFIERYRGESELGIFAALAYLIVAGDTLISAMGQACIPRLANHYAAGERDSYLRLLLRLLGVGVLIGIGGIGVAFFGGRLLLTLLYRPEYAEHLPVFVTLMIAGGLSYVASFMNCGMMAARYFRLQLPLFGFVTVVTGMAAWFMIPRLGLMGATYSLIVGASLQIVGGAGVIVHALHNISERGQYMSDSKT